MNKGLLLLLLFFLVGKKKEVSGGFKAGAVRDHRAQGWQGQAWAPSHKPNPHRADVEDPMEESHEE